MNFKEWKKKTTPPYTGEDIWNACKEECAKVVDDMECEADGYHRCQHNESIAKAIRELK